ncbi:MAG TPA: hypothetical protein RMH99_30655 [Sandaracinaceae bacterium LLY-WYZ-13_1]|nr:hypothetical protein [Sandaracinaceae bacterium LLY-WYZ-13_1]
MLFDLAFDDEPTQVFQRVAAPAPSEPPPLPFPLLREKRDPEPERAIFELVQRREGTARLSA